MSPSERSPWMGAVNVRRRDMGSPKPAPFVMMKHGKRDACPTQPRTTRRRSQRPQSVISTFAIHTAGGGITPAFTREIPSMNNG